MKGNPKSLSAYKLKSIGNGLFGQERLTEALDLYTQASLAPGGARLREVWSNKSAVLLALNEPEEALLDAVRCKNVDKSWPKAYLRLAAVHAALDSPSEALQACTVGLALVTSTPGSSEDKRSVKRALRRIQITEEIRLQESMFRKTDSSCSNQCVSVALETAVQHPDEEVKEEDVETVTESETETEGKESNQEDRLEQVITMDSTDELREIQSDPCWSDFMNLMDSQGPKAAVAWAKQEPTANALLSRLSDFLHSRFGIRVDLAAAKETATSPSLTSSSTSSPGIIEPDTESDPTSCNNGSGESFDVDIYGGVHIHGLPMNPLLAVPPLESDFATVPGHLEDVDSVATTSADDDIDSDSERDLSPKTVPYTSHETVPYTSESEAATQGHSTFTDMSDITVTDMTAATLPLFTQEGHYYFYEQQQQQQEEESGAHYYPDYADTSPVFTYPVGSYPAGFVEGQYPAGFVGFVDGSYAVESAYPMGFVEGTYPVGFVEGAYACIPEIFPHPQFDNTTCFVYPCVNNAPYTYDSSYGYGPSPSPYPFPLPYASQSPYAAQSLTSPYDSVPMDHLFPFPQPYHCY